MKMTKAELKRRFGIDENENLMTLDELNEELIREISKWSPEQKKAAWEYLMQDLLRGMKCPNGLIN
jgi:hypothetical protein